MLYLFLAVLCIVAVAFLALGVNIIFFKRPFPETEISRNKNMHKMGIHCAKCEELQKAGRRKKLQTATLDVQRLILSNEDRK